MPHFSFCIPKSTISRLVASSACAILIATALPSVAAQFTANTVAPGTNPSIPTIPVGNYPIPSNAIFVSPTGNDSSAGTENAPLKTIRQAIRNVSNGGTIVAKEGVYREGMTSKDSTDRQFTLQAAPNAQVWIDGTVTTNGWISDPDGGYRLDNAPSSNLCNDKTRCVENVDQISTDAPMAWSPQMVFVNNIALKEVATRNDAKSGNNFYFDIASNKLYMGVDPAGKQVDVTNKRSFLRLKGSNTSIKGIGFRRFGSILNPGIEEFPSAALNISEISSNTKNILIEDSVFFQNASTGLAFNRTDNITVRGSKFLSNGQNGFDAHLINNSLFENNLISDNIKENFNNNSGAYKVTAGTKMTKTKTTTLRNNIVEYNNGTGIWCDMGCENMKYYGNVAHDNNGHGIFYEISTTGTIASNVIYNNSSNGIKLNGDNNIISNNTLYDNGVNIGVYEDDRTGANAKQVAEFGNHLETSNNRVINNIVASSTTRTNSLVTIQGYNFPETVAPNQMVTELNFNTYYRAAGKPTNAIIYQGKGVNKTYPNIDVAKNEQGIEADGLTQGDTSKPLFVDSSKYDFRLDPSSSSVGSAKPLTGDLVFLINDLGLTGSKVDRGALVWPGRDAGQSTTTTTTTTTQPTTTTTTTQPTTTTTTTTTQPKPTTTTTQPKPTTTTTQPKPTTTTTTTTQPKPAQGGTEQGLLTNVVGKMIKDNDLAKVRQYSYKDNIFKGRAYYKKSGFFYRAVDFTATITKTGPNEGTYTVTSIDNAILSFKPIS